MKTKLNKIILKAAGIAHRTGRFPSDNFPEVLIEVPKLESHGDYSTSFAMMSAGTQKMSPRKIAEAILEGIEDSGDIISDIQIAGPGFINFYIKPSAWHPILSRINAEDLRYGASDRGQRRKVQVEFVSANPTGPLHVGHGRGAAVGDSLANILSFYGCDVQREYYINNSGRQIHTLGRSVYIRFLSLHGREVVFPDNCYQGDYILDLARQINAEKGDSLLAMPEDKAIQNCARFAADKVLAGIRSDLEHFGIVFDRWYSEQSLYDDGKVDRMIDDLLSRDLVYREDGALWFRTTSFGDEKDRVVVRTNGQTTYFASDIAYHHDKYLRGFDRVIDIWGADHHGYIPRMNAAVEASGRNRNQFDVILVRLVNLLRNGKPVAMSTRAGEFVTLGDVIDEVGRDAARFIFLTRHYDSTLDFDLELAKRKTNDNPVYYVQYVHARIASIIRKSVEKEMGPVTYDPAAVSMLTVKEEIGLIKRMDHFPEVILRSAEEMTPHRIAFYLIDLAAAFHAYYNKHRVLTDDPILARGRLYLVAAVKKVIRNGLTLLGVSAPERM
ncbi:MAG: arginine--tRNA ligase [Thermodesulfobacteriota bacterium]|nr:arginine--tRNA ligase [Thermodesulfobacteriota bacterium]